MPSTCSYAHLCYDLKGVVIRNDNGSQFLASAVRNFLIHLEAEQEFTYISIPEQNAYIDAFHSILRRELVDRFEFSSVNDANMHIEKYMPWYDSERRHRSMASITSSQNGGRDFSVRLIGRAVRWMRNGCQSRMI